MIDMHSAQNLNTVEYNSKYYMYVLCNMIMLYNSRVYYYFFMLQSLCPTPLLCYVYYYAYVSYNVFNCVFSSLLACKGTEKYVCTCQAIVW